MKQLFTLCFICGTMAAAFAQRPAADELKTAKGPLKIQPVEHGSLVLTWDNKTIYVDPYGGAKAYKGLAAPDLILITDIHPDHMDTATLNAIETGKVNFIVPQAVADKLPAKWKDKVIVLGNGKNLTEKGA